VLVASDFLIGTAIDSFLNMFKITMEPFHKNVKEYLNVFNNDVSLPALAITRQSQIPRAHVGLNCRSDLPGLFLGFRANTGQK
jgi:hypothetical protein